MPAEWPDVQIEFKTCLAMFPELDNVRLVVEVCDELSGAEGFDALGQRIVILFAPVKLLAMPVVLRPIIIHELSHMINWDDPDSVFFERADEQSKQMWQALEQAGALACSTENDVVAIHT